MQSTSPHPSFPKGRECFACRQRRGHALRGIPTFALGIILFLIPFVRFLWDDWSQFVLFLIVLCLWILFLFTPHLNPLPFRGEGGGEGYSGLISLLLAALFLICFSISSFLTPSKETVRLQFLQLFSAISLFFIAKNLSDHSKTILQAIICLVTSLFSLFFIFSRLFVESFPPRSSSEFFINPNLVSAFSLIGLFVSLHSYFSQNYPHRILAIIAIALNSGAFLFTLSLGALIAACVAFLTMVRSSKKWMLLLALPISILFILYGRPFSQSISDRVNWWSASFQILLQSPFFGSGPGTYEKLSPYFFAPGLASPYAHNFFLQTASEWGILSFLPFILFIGLQIKTAPRSFLTAGLIALLTQNLYDYSMNIPGYFIYFWTLLGISQNQAEILPPSTPHVIPAKAGIQATDSRLHGNDKAFGVWQHLYLSAIRGFLLLVILFAGWSLGIKPLLAFSETLQAQKAFERNNLKQAEKHLKKAIAWDSLPSKTYSDCSKLLFMQYQLQPKELQLLQEAIHLQKQALQKEPLSIFYKARMDELLKQRYS